MDELLLPELAPARPALVVDVDELVPVSDGADAVDVTVTKTVLPGWPLLDATVLAVVITTTDAEVDVVLLSAVVGVVCVDVVSAVEDALVKSDVV